MMNDVRCLQQVGRNLSRKKLMIIAAVFLAVLAVGLLLTDDLVQFNQRPELSFNYPEATLTSRTLAEPCTVSNAIRGGTQADFYDYEAPASADEITAFYEEDDATCQRYESPRMGVECRKDYGDSVSYSVYVEESPDQTTPTSHLHVEVRWVC
jgi:hypothetical protein